MAADGVSLQTTISQLGNVAKTQLKEQAGQNQTGPLSDQVDKSKDLKVNRVKQAEKADKGRIEPDAEKQRERRRQKAKNAEKADETEAGKEAGQESVTDQDTLEQDRGLHIDTRV
jgi:hypothetical protein